MPTTELRSEFESTTEALRAAPTDAALWDRLETLAGSLDCADEVAALYREILATGLGAGDAMKIAKRATQFHEEWLGQDRAGLESLLLAILDIDPTSEWAFQRLTVVLTVAERWDDLLALYDRCLAGADDDARRIVLLDEAAQVAKDVANQPEKAIGYLQALLPLKPRDGRLAVALERLLERHERWRDLIDLWESRLSKLPAGDALDIRARIAECWLDKLGDAGRALDAAKHLLDEADDDTRACALLERVVTAAEASAEVRDRALATLRAHYESSGRPREIVRVLEAAIELADERERAAMHREAAERLDEMGEDAAALAHYAPLLSLQPSSSVTQEQMRRVAQRAGLHDDYARGIAAAAAAAEPVRKVGLLAEAAKTRLEILDDASGAIDLYQAALAEPGATDSQILSLGRKLAELLMQAGRDEERLGVLERLAAAESAPSTRRALISDAARLAEELGDADRALAAWKRRLDTDPRDLAALTESINLLEKERRWEPLIEALRHRVSISETVSQRRADLIRIALICERELEDADRAIAAWRQVAEECGEDTEVVDALAALLTASGRWQELAELLERACAVDTGRLGDRLVALGDAYHAHMDAPARALVACHRALRIDARHAGARAGLTALLALEDHRAAAADALAAAYRDTEDWEPFLELVGPRLAAATDAATELVVLREAADVQEHRVGDAAAALASTSRALPIVPKDRALEERMLRLARSVGDFAPAASAYRDAADRLEGDPHEVARLRYEQGSLLERELGDAEAALAAYLAVVAIDPAHEGAARGAVRLGARLGRWGEVADTFAAFARARRGIDHALLDEIEQVAAETAAWTAVAQELGRALAEPGELPARACAELWWRIAGWYRDKLEDDASARTGLSTMVAFDSERVDGWRALAAIQRDTPDRDYFDTLRRIAELDPADLGAAHEAARVALEALADRERARESLGTLLGRATAAWRTGAEVTTDLPPRELVAWTAENLATLHCEAGDPNAAIDLLVDIARLPFDDDHRRALRLRAAEIATDQANDPSLAIEMYRAVLSQAPADETALAKLAELYTAGQRTPELLALRRHELGLDPSPERRLELRLEIARMVGEIEERGGRIEALRANLEDNPGHPQSIDALCEVLDAKARHRELTDLLSAQADKLEELGQDGRAAEILALIAELAERDLSDIDRALDAHRRVVRLAATPTALDALARLHMDRGEPERATPWLDQRLVSASPAERAEVVMRLARAHVAADNIDRAIESLERGIGADPDAMPLRDLIADLYRRTESWEKLAQVLTDTLPHLSDDERAIACAREAVEIFHRRLDTPERAIPALERAIALSPGDRQMRLMLAKGLRIVDRVDEARTTLEQIVEEFGRRRSPERAAVHVELAQLDRAEGQLDKALENLELASRMDVGNPHVLRALAQLARERGKLEDAERSYRALLLVVRRQPDHDDESAVGASEILFELHKLAGERGDDDQAAELLESALSEAAQSDAEVHRLRRTLVAESAFDVLERALSLRLEASDDDAAKHRLYTELAELLEHRLDRPEQALDARLKALALAPGRADAHRTARELARSLDRADRYVEATLEALDRLRREEEQPLAAQLLLNAASAVEEDLADLERARDLYRRAEEIGAARAQALVALARISHALGDVDGQARALDALTEMAGGDAPSPEQADALYRLAEIQIELPDRREAGVRMLVNALKAEPRYAVACAILRRAADAEPEDDAVLELYEKSARASGDWQALLDVLGRRAARPSATPEQIREAVDLAAAHDEPERAEELLSRAVEAARSGPHGVAGAVWAAMALAERRAEAGDLASAAELFGEVAHVADAARAMALGLAIAGRAEAEQETTPLAVEVYDRLRQQAPAAREVWEPLLALCRRIGDHDRLQAIVTSTLPHLVDTSARNAMRMEHARYLVDRDESSRAIEVLRDVLLDDPDHIDATDLLESILVRAGDDDALSDFLWQRFAEAKERGNADSVADVAIRLGALLARTDSGEALAVYRQALAIAPDHPELLRVTVAELDREADARERAELMERRLATAEGDDAAALAIDLADAWESLGDEEAVERVLEIGHARAPDGDAVRERLEAWYRERSRFSQLAALIARDADRYDDPAQRVARLREAASIERDQLSSPRAAATTLKAARVAAPHDQELLAELLACFAEAGDQRGAVNAIGEALADDLGDAVRLDLLLERGRLLFELGDGAGALADLEAGYAISPEAAGPRLTDALERVRQHAASEGNRDAERETTMRLVELLGGSDGGRARELLAGWVAREPGDRDALYTLRDVETAAASWEGVAVACAQLVSIEEGDAQIDAAVRLAEASEQLGDPERARDGLEQAYSAQPESPVLREYLRQIYERAGAHRELAQMLVADAGRAGSDKQRYALLRRAAEILLHDLGDAEAAMEAAAQAHAIKPSDHETVILLADVYIAGSRLDDAVDLLDPAIAAHKRRSPKLAALQRRMANVAAASGNREAQLAWLKKAFDVDRKSGEIAAELAHLATEFGDYDLALKPLRAISLMENPGPVSRVMALLWEAKIEHARGNRAKAELWAKKALREDPNFAEAQEFLSELAE